MRALLFHNVVKDSVDPFDRACERLQTRRFAACIDDLQTRYDLVPFEPGMWSLRRESAKPPLLLTFDDGFAGVFEAAFPVLQERNCVATVFVLTDQGAPIAPDRLLHFERLEIAVRLSPARELDLQRASLGRVSLESIPDRVAALKAIKRWLKHLPGPESRAEFDAVIADLGVDEARLSAFAAAAPDRFRKLSRAQIETLVSHGWTIGGHTRSHPSLAFLEASALEGEVRRNAADLDLLGLAPAPFAYPYGGPEHVSDAAEAAIREAGFCCAFTTVPGDNDAGTNPFRLRRFSLPALQWQELSGTATRVPGP